MELLTKKTEDQLLAEQNAKIQNDIWLRNERLLCRKLALQIIKETGSVYDNTDKIIKEANKIYDFLVKELE